MQLIEQLQSLGLNEKEAKIYLASLELGLASIQNIAKKAQVKRTTVYEILDSLIQQNLITVTSKGKKRYFLAAEPAQLNQILQKRQAMLHQILPELEALSKVSPVKPKIRFYEGLEGIKTVYEDTLKEGKEIKAFASISPIFKMPALSDYLVNHYVKQRAAKKILAKVIAPDAPSAKDYQKRDLAEYRQTKLISENDFPFTVEINIYGNKIAYMSFKSNELVGVIIESKEISQTMGLIFDFFWGKIK